MENFKKEKEDIEKEVKIEPGTQNFYLTVFSLILKGKNPADICSELNISKQALNYYIRRLKKKGLIRKIGYGVWESTGKPFTKQVKIEPVDTPTNHPKIFTSSVRSHAFIFKLILPNIPNWKKRADFLTSKNIDFKTISSNKVQSIIHKRHKIWLCDNAIIIYFPDWRSYFVNSAKEGYNYAVYDFQQLIQSLESLFQVSLKINKYYEFEVSKQHHSLIHNELARQYNRDKRKLMVYDRDGHFWLLIDDSEHLDELEMVSEKTSVRDTDDIIKPFLNDLRETKLMPGDILNMFDKIGKIQTTESEKMAFYAENIKSHTEAIIKLSDGIDDLIGIVKKKKRIKKVPSYIG